MSLRSRLQDSRPLIMPDAYDALSARLIEDAGFEAVQCSGYSISIALGLEQEDFLSFDRNLQITHDICKSVRIPVMADGEDGYGPPSTVATTVDAFIQAGVDGINLEDQLLRTDTPGVVDVNLMTEKLLAARESANRSGRHDFVINGRTDVLAVSPDREQGLKTAILRGKQYLDAGADSVFVTNVITLEEARRIVEGIPGPVSIAAGLPYNQLAMPIPDLIAIGPARISFPIIAIASATKGIKEGLVSLVKEIGLKL